MSKFYDEYQKRVSDVKSRTRELMGTRSKHSVKNKKSNKVKADVKHYGNGGNLQLSEHLKYDKIGAPLDEKEWEHLLFERYRDRNHESWENHNNRSHELKLKELDIGIIKQIENRNDKNSDRLYELLNTGKIIFNNGRYYSNDKRISEFLEETKNKIKADERKKYIEENVLRDKHNFESRTATNVSNRFIKLKTKKYAKKYDRMQLKQLKKEYKRNKLVNKWEKKYGSLSK